MKVPGWLTPGNLKFEIFYEPSGDSWENEKADFSSKYPGKLIF